LGGWCDFQTQKKRKVVFYRFWTLENGDTLARQNSKTPGVFVGFAVAKVPFPINSSDF
jgi:hypothetical protein